MAKSTSKSALKNLKQNYVSHERRSFIDDIYEQINDSEEIFDIIEQSRNAKSDRYVCVTFDKIRNDARFSYAYFDIMLATLDALSYGGGLFKPNNQVRALRWGSTRQNLLKVINYLTKINREIKVRRVLILPYPNLVVGKGVDSSIYLSNNAKQHYITSLYGS